MYLMHVCDMVLQIDNVCDRQGVGQVPGRASTSAQSPSKERGRDKSVAKDEPSDEPLSEMGASAKHVPKQGASHKQPSKSSLQEDIAQEESCGSIPAAWMYTLCGLRFSPAAAPQAAPMQTRFLEQLQGYGCRPVFDTGLLPGLARKMADTDNKQANVGDTQKGVEATAADAESMAANKDAAQTTLAETGVTQSTARGPNVVDKNAEVRHAASAVTCVPESKPTDEAELDELQPAALDGIAKQKDASGKRRSTTEASEAGTTLVAEPASTMQGPDKAEDGKAEVPGAHGREGGVLQATASIGNALQKEPEDAPDRQPSFRLDNTQQARKRDWVARLAAVLDRRTEVFEKGMLPCIYPVP
jgi:hypothetical protein